VRVFLKAAEKKTNAAIIDGRKTKLFKGYVGLFKEEKR